MIAPEIVLRLRSAVFLATFYLWFTFVALVGLVTLALPVKASLFVVNRWAGGVIFFARVMVGIKYQIEGERPPPGEPILIAAKHQSAYETVLLLRLFKNPVFVLKRELLQLPLYGWYARRAGMIGIDRNAGTAALQQMRREADAALKARRSIIIFPEGTRMAPGAPPRYRPGIFLLADTLKLATYPLALDSGHYWPKASWIKRPGTIRFKFLPPLAAGLTRGDFMRQLETTTETAFDDALSFGAQEIRYCGLPTFPDKSR